MKNTFTITVLLFSSIFSSAQSKHSNDTMHWSSNISLTWTDFKGEAIEGVGFIGEAFCMLLANYEKTNAFQKTTYKVYAVWDRTKSWIEPQSKSKDALKFFKIMFNMYEVHARKLRKDFSETSFGLNPNQIFQEKYNAAMTGLTDEFNLFKKETKMGSNKNELEKWNIKIQEELSELEQFR